MCIIMLYLLKYWFILIIIGILQELSNIIQNVTPQLQTDNNSSQSKTTTFTPAYYNITTDDSSFAESRCENDVDTDDDLIEMSAEEKKDVKYLSIFKNSYHDFDEEIMIVENMIDLKRWKNQWSTWDSKDIAGGPPGTLLADWWPVSSKVLCEERI